MRERLMKVLASILLVMAVVPMSVAAAPVVAVSQPREHADCDHSDSCCPDAQVAHCRSCILCIPAIVAGRLAFADGELRGTVVLIARQNMLNSLDRKPEPPPPRNRA